MKISSLIPYSHHFLIYCVLFIFVKLRESLGNGRLRKSIYIQAFKLLWKSPNFEEMKNTLIHNCIGSHTNCFIFSTRKTQDETKVPAPKKRKAKIRQKWNYNKIIHYKVT